MSANGTQSRASAKELKPDAMDGIKVYRSRLAWLQKGLVILLVLVILLLAARFSSGAQAPGEGQGSPIYPKELQSYDNFGAALAVREDTLVVGAPGVNQGDYQNSGAAFVFERREADWGETQRLSPDPLQSDSGFGSSVAIDGDTLAVGAIYEYNPQSGNGSGAVYVYTQDSDSWQLQARLAAADGAPFDLFGWDLALQGDLLAVSARAAESLGGARNAGAVYLFQRTGDTWNPLARLSPQNLSSRDYFGDSIALAGEYLFAGAPGHDETEIPGAGAVYVFRQQGQNWFEELQLTADNLQPNAHFGAALDVEEDLLLVLASQQYHGEQAPPAAHLYGAPQGFGVAHVFKLEQGEWQWQVSLAPQPVGEEGSVLLGTAIGAGQNGGMRAVLSGYGRGEIYRYDQKGTDWIEGQPLTPNVTGLTWGKTIALSGKKVLIGVPHYDHYLEQLNQGDDAGAIIEINW
ncbi:MAG: FG-GAP repeat protein [Anaerolineales bacterium]|jgi:hypothetical protein